jgi:hypothetical protein
MLRDESQITVKNVTVSARQTSNTMSGSGSNSEVAALPRHSALLQFQHVYRTPAASANEHVVSSRGGCATASMSDFAEPVELPEFDP